MSFGIWNNLDEMALFLGLERLEAETDEEFYNRIRLFGRWKYKTDYYTQVHSLPLQLGLKTKNIVKFESLTPFTCTIDWEYFTIENETEAVRVFINTYGATVQKILDAIDESLTFSYKLLSSNAGLIQCKFLIRNINTKFYRDFIDTNNCSLRYKDIIEGSIRPEDSSVLLRRVNSIQDLKRDGDYFIDYKSGFISIFKATFDGMFVTYKYKDAAFCLESTEMNLIPMSLYSKYGITDDIIAMSPYALNKKVWG